MNNEHPIVWDDDKVARIWDYYERIQAVNDLYFAKVYGAYVLRRAALPSRKPLRVLDFGCGTGGLWDQMKRAKVRWRYTGLDFSEKSVSRLVQRSSADAGFEGALHVKGLPSSLVDASFDAIFLLEVVEHLTDDRLQATATEVIRLLKPGGKLVVSAPNAEDLAQESKFCPECGAVFHQWQHVRSWTPASLRSIFCELGLQHEVTWIGHWDDHWLGGWIFNRAANFWRGRRPDPHMLVTFVKPAAGA